MPRFTPWYPGAPLDPETSDALVETVLRPSLQRAFPLPPRDHARDKRFHQLLQTIGELERRA